VESEVLEERWIRIMKRMAAERRELNIAVLGGVSVCKRWEEVEGLEWIRVGMDRGWNG
jgi:hypothetical protein